MRSLPSHGAHTKCSYTLRLAFSGGLYFTGAYITGAGIIGALQFGGALFSSEPVTEPGHPAGTQGASPPPVSEATPIVPDTSASEAAPTSGAAKSHGAQALPLAPVDAAPGSCPDVNDVCDCTTVTQLNTLAQGGAQVPISCSPQSALWVQQTLVFLFHLAAGLGVGITLIYWLLLFNYSSPPEGAGLYRSVQTHISILVPVLEMAMGRVPVLSSHFPAFLLVCLLYLIVNGAFTAANPGESLYSILTWTRGTDAVVAIGVFLLVIVAYWSAFSLTRIRDFMARAWRGEAPASAGTLLAAPSSKVEPAQAGAEAEAASDADAASQV